MHICDIKSKGRRQVYRSFGQDRSGRARGIDWQGAIVDHGRFGANASGLGHEDATGGSIRPNQSLSLVTAGKSGANLAGTSHIAVARICTQTAAIANEPNLDSGSDRCYGGAVVGPGVVATVMSKAEGAKVKISFWEAMRPAWKPYRRLYGYAGPYKWRFALGLAFGIAYGVIT